MASGDGDVAFVRQNTIYQMTANSTGKYKVDVSHVSFSYGFSFLMKFVCFFGDLKTYSTLNLTVIDQWN